MSDVEACNLSRVFHGKLEVTIEGKGTWSVTEARLTTLKRFVMVAEAKWKGERPKSIRNYFTPWKIIAFDPDARTLLVKPV